MAMEKSLINQQEYTLIKMDILSKSVTANAKKCRKRVNKIRRQISQIVGLDKGVIEMIKPREIPNGLRLECYLYVSNEESIKNEYHRLIEEAKANGTISQCIYESWKLSGVPNIINLEIVEIRSELDKLGVYSQSIQTGITTKTVSIEMGDGEELDGTGPTTTDIEDEPRATAVASAVVTMDSMVDAYISDVNEQGVDEIGMIHHQQSVQL